MARSHTPEATIVNSDVEVDESVIEVETSSANEVSDNPPDAASSVERSFPPAQPLRKFWIELPPLPKDYDEYKYLKVPRLQKSKEASSSEQDEETSRVPAKLVGEVVQNRSKYYYAEVQGGVITKVCDYGRFLRRFRDVLTRRHSSPPILSRINTPILCGHTVN